MPGPAWPRCPRTRATTARARSGPAPSRSWRSSWVTATTAPPTERASGQVIGTYLHGPLLARNADLADLLLGWALGAALDPAPATTSDALRAQRIAEDRADPSGWGGRLYGKAHRRSRPSLRRRSG